MYCIKCGKENPDSNNFCNNCGTAIYKENATGITPQPAMNNQTPQTQTKVQPRKKKKSPLMIVLIIIGVLVGLFVLFLIGVYLFVVNTADQMVCTSTTGNITIMYNDEMIVGYTANGFTYDVDGQRDYADKIGIDAYLKEFSEWFSNNTDGTCSYKTPSTNTPIEEEQDTKTIGTDAFGYVEVPSNWYEFHDVDGNDSLQYSYGNVYIFTMNVIDNSGLSAKELAQNYMAVKSNETDITGLTGATVTIGDKGQYTAYQVYMYYPQDNVYLITYWFETEDNKVHYMALEGPEEVGDMNLFDLVIIPESFHLVK